jgi:hypothetical protein
MAASTLSRLFSVSRALFDCNRQSSSAISPGTAGRQYFTVGCLLRPEPLFGISTVAPIIIIALVDLVVGHTSQQREHFATLSV